MASFSLSATGSSEWQPVYRPTILLLYGTWQGSAQLQCRAVGDGSNVSNVGAAIAHTDNAKAVVINHPAGVTLEYRVSFTRTSGTLEGRIGG